MSAGNGTPDQQRATRRQFFRVFGRQTVSGANNVLAGVDSLRRSSQDAIGELLGATDDAPTPRHSAELAGPPTALPPEPYRSPFRFTGRAVELLDQRELPARATTIECRAASEVASALRKALVSGGPVVGQLAAYTVVAAVAQATPGTGGAQAERAAMLAALDALRPARPTSRALAVGLERMRQRGEAADTDQPGALLSALTDEADRIAAEDVLDHARLGRLGAAALRPTADAAAAHERPLGLLLHGDQGPLVGGQVGLGVALIQALAADDRPALAWLTEAEPIGEGRRAAWQLGHLEIAHALVPDTALGWLLANRPLDALLLRAEWLLADGTIVAPLGSLVAAREARAAGITVAASAPLAIYDPVAGHPDTAIDARLPAPEAGHEARLDPAADIVPAELLDLLLTDEGPLSAPFATPIAAAAMARVDRHAALRRAAVGGR